MLDNGGYLIWTTVFERCICWLLNQRIPIGTAQIVPSGSHDKFPPYFPLLPLFTECSSLSCSHWLAAWLGLPSHPESVAPSSDSPPINRYSMLSCSLTLPDVSLIYPCCLPLVWPFDSDWTEYTATLYILLISDACLGSNIFFWLKLLCLFHFFPHQCSYLNSPLLFFLFHFRLLLIAVWIFVFALSGFELIIHLCTLLAFCPICYIDCTSMQSFWWQGEKLYLEVMSPQVAVPVRKSIKSHFKKLQEISCFRCSLCNPSAT